MDRILFRLFNLDSLSTQIAELASSSLELVFQSADFLEQLLLAMEVFAGFAVVGVLVRRFGSA